MFRDPTLLILLAALPLLGWLSIRAARLRRRGMERLGRYAAVLRLVRGRPGRRSAKGLLLVVGLAAGIVGLAGPRWGEEPGQVRRAEQDLMVVLDVSRSMQAEQPSRLTRAVRALQDLVASARPRGDIRFGLVLAASRPVLVFPLTREYDGLDRILANLSQGDLPPELWPVSRDQGISGTRLGAALRVAARSFPERGANHQDILLLSDGDDPIEDEEWRIGTAAATERRVPIHVAGIGDPTRSHLLSIFGEPVLHLGRQVATAFDEKLVQAIARTTGGHYFPMHTNPRPPLAALYRSMQFARTTTQESELRAGLSQPVSRHVWFLAAAVVFFLTATAIRECPGAIGPRRETAGGRRNAPRFAGPVLACLALALVSAAPLRPVEQQVRAGDAAFAAGHFKEALQHYGAAEVEARDPGRVAFNKAAAYYRLGSFAQAADHWRRALDDAAAPTERRARAAFQLGNAAMRLAQGNDRERLQEAVAAYRRCLAFSSLDPTLAENARANLDLALRLWLEASRRADPGGGNEKGPGPSDPKTPGAKKQPGNGEKGPLEKTKENGAMKEKGGKETTPGKKEPRDDGMGGILQVRDGGVPSEPLLPAEARETLERALRRIEEERRRYRMDKLRASPDIPNW